MMMIERTVAEALAREPVLLREISKAAQLALRLGAYDDAKRLFEGLLAVSPNDAELNYGLATTYVALERLGDALARYDATIRSAFSHVGALAGRGELMARLGRRGEAAADLTRAVAYDGARNSEEGRRAAKALSLIQLPSRS